MNGVHDMGGMDCYGAIDVDDAQCLFHESWERRVLALTLAMGATGTWNLDKSRFTRESLPPSYYLSAGYYRIWLAALENLLLEYELASAAELKTGRMLEPAKAVKNKLLAEQVEPALRRGSAVDRASSQAAKFSVGDEVYVPRKKVTGHTRLPQYIAGCIGVIDRVHGCHVFPDAHAAGLGEQPQWLYNIRFEAKTLWGESSANTGFVQVDCWEPYLHAVNEHSTEHSIKRDVPNKS